MHLGAGNGGEVALRVIQSAHSEAQTETDEPERLMKVETEKLEREREERDRGNKAAVKRRGREKQMKVKGMEKECPGDQVKMTTGTYLVQNVQ